MKRFRLHIPTLLLMTTATCSLLGSFAASRSYAAETRPNILFIFTDDHASHSISSYGSKINTTPNLDRIANEGMLFRNCFCTNSICGPSRAVIITGKHNHLNGFIHNGLTFDGSQQTFPKLLRKVGYQTAIVGKWHLRSAPTGFDYSEVLIGQGPYYNPPMRLNGNPQPVKHVGYTTDIITDLAIDFLKNKRDKSKPFMLMFQHKAPHRNWQPGPKHLSLYDDVTIPEPDNLFDTYEGRGRAAHEQDMSIAKTMTAFDLKLTPPRNLTKEQLEVWNNAYDPKNEAFRKADLKGKDLVRWKYQRYIKDYLRCIASVDDNVGRMLDYLDEAGLSENTVVMYSSDQGFYLGEHGWFDKRFMYEESYRMPFMVRWPGVIKPGSINDQLVSNLDYAETFLEVAGAKIPGDMQGRSLVPLFKGERSDDWRTSLYYHYYEFFGDRRAAHMVRRHYGVRTGRYKLIHFYNLDEWELYDLEKDPREMESMYDNPYYTGVVQELKSELARLQNQYNVPDDKGSVAKNPPSLKPGFRKQQQQKKKKKKKSKKKKK
jgi:arylsulfatase A-like enzyme